MSVVEIEQELQKMNNAERLIVIEIAAKFLKADFENDSEAKRKLRQSAEVMREEYAQDKNLTAITDLDGEDFYDV